MTRLHGIVGLALLLVVLAPFAGAAKETTEPTPPSELPQPVLDSFDAALEAYEEIRKELAADSLEGVPTSAARLGEALRPVISSRASLGEELAGLVEEAAFIAESVAAAEDLSEARAAFAELSRRFLLVTKLDNRVTEGWHVFSCPMVDTFDKWLQPSAQIENPYMGSSMLTCGTPADWSVAEAESWLNTPEASAPDPSGGPTFEPGVPGLKMVDVRDYKFLWRELDQLQVWERGERITVAEYRDKVIEKTAHFLELEGAAADDFIARAADVVDSVRDSFARHQKPGPTHVGGGGGFSTDLSDAADQLASMLGDEPRHQLFAPECKKWLLKLAFGPKEAKEAREAREVKKL
jgi:hypothetical protein